METELSNLNEKLEIITDLLRDNEFNKLERLEEYKETFSEVNHVYMNEIVSIRTSLDYLLGINVALFAILVVLLFSLFISKFEF